VQSAFVARSEWNPPATLLCTGFILVVTIAGVPLALRGINPYLLVLIQQALTVLMVLLAAGRQVPAALALNPVQPGSRVNLAAIPFLVVIPAGLLASYFHLPVQLTVSQGDTLSRYLDFVSLVIGAPFSEELLFRGFLLSALSKISFWPAAIAVDVIWTAMRWHLPIPGLVATFVLGLLLSFVLWRGGSLWTCILAHALCNLEPAVAQLIFR
jgi:membrane protease YdiL (CAAX protease family)